MKSLKLPAVYGALTVLTGITAGSPKLVALSMGLSLFIPALFVLTARESLAAAALATILSLGALALYSPRAPFDVLPFQAVGALLLKLLERPTLAVLGGALVLFTGAVLEELLVGLPEDVKSLPLFGSYRWGIYFFTALLFSEAVYGIALIFLRRGELFLRLKFGFLPVFLFLITGSLSLLAQGAVKVVAVNLLIATLGIFTAQGVAVLLYFIGRLSPLLRLLTLVLVLFFPMGFLAGALLLGFLDNWLDFRKLSGGGSDGSNSA